MRELFQRIDLGKIEYNVIVATRFGITLCSSSGDNLVHSSPILKTGIEGINSTRGPTTNIKRINNKKARRRSGMTGTMPRQGEN